MFAGDVANTSLTSAMAESLAIPYKEVNDVL
jgi:hypothetical protein